MRLNLTGTATAGYNLVVPAIEKPYIINNGTDGTITVKNTTGTGIAVPAGSTMWVYNNGTDVVSVVTYMTAIAGSNTSPSYTFAGDLNTGMWSPAADTIAFSEGGVEAMRINSAGDVGIGTTSPGRRLSIAGGGFAFDDANTISRSVHWGNGSIYSLLVTGDAPNGVLSFGTNTNGNAATEKMRIDASGNVGIGVTSPPQLLAVGSATDQVGVGISAAVSTLYFGSPSTGSGGIRRLAYDRATGNFDFIGNSVASPTTQMTLTAAGLVGIGTSAPGKTLDLVGQFRASGTAASGYALLEYGTSATATNNWHVGSEGDGTFRWYNGNLGGGTERMRIDASGNVGIGTASPTAKLDVIGNANFGAAIVTGTGLSTGDAQLELGGNRSGDGPAYMDFHAVAGGDFNARVFRGSGANGNMEIVNTGTGVLSIATNATEKMRIEAGGNVGIGTTSPGYRLDIASGDTSAGLGYALRIRSNATAAAATIQFTTSTVSTQNGLIACTDTGGMTIQSDGASSVLAFRTNGSEQLRILNTGGITSADAADAVGYKGIPQNSQTATYTLALSDMGKHISITTGGVVIPANSGVAFPIGSAVTIFNNSGSSQTVSITTDTLRLAGTATTGTRTLAQYGIATVIKVTSTVWVISGAGVS
jgi:hypothetical protein